MRAPRADELAYLKGLVVDILVDTVREYMVNDEGFKDAVAGADDPEVRKALLTARLELIEAEARLKVEILKSRFDPLSVDNIVGAALERMRTPKG